jgi:uncharacterized protein (DUF1330 family)
LPLRRHSKVAAKLSVRFLLGNIMNKGSWIVRADVSDLDKLGEYAKRTPAVVEKYNGKFLVRAGNHECVEGTTRSRNTIIEFPSFKAAMDCWNSVEYIDAKSYRVDAAELDIVVIEGG